MNVGFRNLLVAAMVCWSGASLADCPAYSDQRLISITEALTRLVDSARAARGEPQDVALQPAPSLHELMAAESDQVMDAMCDFLTRYPSLESMLETSADELQRNGVLDWITEASASQQSMDATDHPCLNTDQFIVLRTATLALETAVAVANGFCKSALCSPAGSCVVACTVAGALELGLPNLNWGVFADLQLCMTNHTTEMEDWCDSTLGCSSSRGATTATLADIQQDVEFNLVPSLSSSTEQVAVQQDLETTSQDFGERLDHSIQQTTTVFLDMQELSSQNAAFRQRLERLEIEASLADGRELVDLKLPGQFGGRLSVVREVVSTAINDYQRSGLGIGEALDLFRQGDAFFNNGQYSAAFDAYRNAYLELTL